MSAETPVKVELVEPPSSVDDTPSVDGMEMDGAGDGETIIVKFQSGLFSERRLVSRFDSSLGTLSQQACVFLNHFYPNHAYVNLLANILLFARGLDGDPESLTRLHNVDQLQDVLDVSIVVVLSENATEATDKLKPHTLHVHSYKAPTFCDYCGDRSYTWIFDLRTSDQIEFTVPYTATVPWLQLGDEAFDNDPINFSTGVLAIEVLNALRAPESVAQNVDLNIWIGGGEDFQLAVPDVKTYEPYNPEFAPTMVAQVLGEFQDPGFNDFGIKPPMFKMSDKDMVAPQVLSIGEDVSNLRTIIKRNGMQYTGNVNQSFYALRLRNFDFGTANQVANDATDLDDQPDVGMIPLTYFSWIFRFFRGSQRWKFFFSGSADENQATTRANYFLGDLPSAVSTLGGIAAINQVYNEQRCGTFQSLNYPYINPITEVTVPYYSTVGITPIYGTNGSNIDDLAKINKNGTIWSYLRAGPNVASNSRIDVFRAAGDDFQFGWLVGPPTIWLRPNWLDNSSIPPDSIPAPPAPP